MFISKSELFFKRGFQKETSRENLDLARTLEMNMVIFGQCFFFKWDWVKAGRLTDSIQFLSGLLQRFFFPPSHTEYAHLCLVLFIGLDVSDNLDTVEIQLKLKERFQTKFVATVWESQKAHLRISLHFHVSPT